MEINVNSKGIKDEPYTDESKNNDLEQFKSRLEELSQNVQDPRVNDNKKHSLFTLISIISALL